MDQSGDEDDNMEQRSSLGRTEKLDAIFRQSKFELGRESTETLTLNDLGSNRHSSCKTLKEYDSPMTDNLLAKKQ